MKRQAGPQISSEGLFAVAQSEQTLREQEHLAIVGKRNAYRGDLLNATAHKVLEEYLPALSTAPIFLFLSGKTKKALSERILGYIVKRYAPLAKLDDMSPYDWRQCSGYRMVESVPLHRLAHVMGHDSFRFEIRPKMYIQGTRHDVQQAIETIAWTCD